MYMHVCTNIQMYIYIHMYIYILYMYIYICRDIDTCMYTNMMNVNMYSRVEN